MREYLVITVLFLIFKISIGSPTIDSPLITLSDVISEQEKNEFLELRDGSAPNGRSARAGSIATSDQYQFVAWLQLKFKSSARNCMATLITPMFLLTARTCLAEHSTHGDGPLAIESWFQMTDFKVLPSSRSIKALVIHPGQPYPQSIVDDCCYFRYDLALLLLKSSISISPAKIIAPSWTSSITAIGIIPNYATGLPQYFVTASTTMSKYACEQTYSSALNPNYDPAVFYSFRCVEPFGINTILGSPLLYGDQIIGVQPYEFSSGMFRQKRAYAEIDTTWISSVTARKF